MWYLLPVQYNRVILNTHLREPLHKLLHVKPASLVCSIHSSLRPFLAPGRCCQFHSCKRSLVATFPPGETAANHYEECGLAVVLQLFKILGAAWAAGILGMHLHTSAEHFGNVIFRYSELTSQYHMDASIDVYHTWQARDKPKVPQIRTVNVGTVIKTDKWTKGACSSTEMWLNDEKLQK